MIAVHKYLETHAVGWSANTARQARYYLVTYQELLGACMVTNEAQPLWGALAGLSPASRKTVWIRLTHVADWLVETKQYETNPLRTFQKKHPGLFRHSSCPERLTIGFEEAEQRLGLLRDEGIRRAAFRLLYGAQRWSDQATGDGRVVGKGGKVRPDFAPSDLSGASVPYNRLYRALKKVGLKPHSLRKLALTRLAEKGVTAADLMAVAGWSSITTAYNYLQAKREDHLKELMHYDSKK
jgi:integrase